MTGSTGRGQTQRPKPHNEPSVLLTNAENEVLFALVGSRCQSLASAVVQVYLADPPSCNKWNKRCCGVAAFIKDNPKKSYYIRVYDIRTKHLIWEQEMYTQFKLSSPRPYFFTFETEDCPAGLNFANEDEAKSFKTAINKKLLERQAKKMERRKTVQRQNAPPSSANNAPKSNLASSTPNLSASTNSLSSMGGTMKKKDKDKKGKKAKLTKEDIGTPTDFRHVSHVGWDPESGYDMNNLDPNLRTLFDKIGVNESQLKDKETAKFIYDFIEKQGGIDAVKKEVESRPLPPPPMGGAPPPPPARGPVPNRGGPPPPPSRNNVPPPPVPRGPPPPGPSRGMGAPPPPPNRGGPPPPPVGKPHGGAPPPPPAMGGAPPPPPPPPPPPSFGGGPAAPPPPAMAAGGPPAPPPMKPSGGGMGMALMDQIHHGTKLKNVDATAKEAPAPSNDRDQLLSQIRGGAALRPVSASSSSHSVAEAQSDDESGIAGALARALASRGKHIQASDDEDSDDSDDDEFEDEDWED